MVEANPTQPQASEETNQPQNMVFNTPDNQAMMDDGAQGAAAAGNQGPPMTSLKMKGLPYSVTRD